MVSWTEERDQCYTIPGRSKAEASDLVITSTILVYDHLASILFDLGSIFSYVFVKFVLDLDLICNMLDVPIYVSTVVREFVVE